MPKQHSVAAIILAAGSSSRMEHGDQRHHKLLLPLGDRPVIAHVIEAALASQARPLIVVLGHQARNIQEIIVQYTVDASMIIIENPDYHQGMSTSLRLGINTVQTLNKDASTISGAIILLGDQPFMSASIIDALINTQEHTQKRIVASSYQGKRGNPVLFDASLFSELATVIGDEGGRSIITRHQQDITLVEMSENMAAHDVDTWEAYQQALTKWEDRQAKQSH